MQLKETIIEPPKRSIPIEWSELWAYRDLFLVMAWRDLSVRYKQTLLGILWVILQPVLTMLVFTFIFNRMAGIQSGDGTPYPIFLYTGLLLWQYFSSTVNNSAQSMVANASLIQKVYFPRLIIPATSATTAFVDLAVSSVVLVAMMLYYGFIPQLSGVAVIPVLLLVVTLTALGAGLFLASLNVKYRDVRYALPFFINIGLYITPVIYPVSMLDRYPAVKTLLVVLNPMAGVINIARTGLLGSSAIGWGTLAVSLIVSIIYFLFGLYYFKRTESYFADIA
ncbi:MAG TPA: ABC transporter permease [Syntrophorhabdaceae bacterium]|nr:ABC transporter permease [Syntrophorhabdaceae bacterium]HQM80385.1 ABC transporter permease [Syntrophorhabdaceae bacterium]